MIDPKKPSKIKVKAGNPTAEQLAAANQFAKQIALRQGLISGENTHVGNQLPRFIDDRGRDVTGMPPPEVGKLSSNVPSYVKSLDWDDKMNLPYYTDEKTGYIQYVPKDLFYSARFNPNRGQSILNFIAKK